MPTDLHLIRHGQSFANVEPVVGGMTGDTGLTPLGRERPTSSPGGSATRPFGQIGSTPAPFPAPSRRPLG